MRSNGKFSDQRVKKGLFPLSTFVLFFLLFALLTTLQMVMIGQAIDYKSLPARNVIAVLVFWVAAAVCLTLLTGLTIRRHYQKPIEEFSEAARKVAAGDFSVYLPPLHPLDKTTHLDVLFMDFNKMVEELGSVETLKTDFVSNVSHEMKTPIAVIKNYAELLRTGNGTAEERQEYARNIEEAAGRLSDLISNILRLNKLENQRIDPEMETYDLCAQLEECILQYEELWDEKDLELEIEMEDRAFVQADRSLLELVWNNLLSNAGKFTEPGGTVTVRQRTVKGYVEVSVADTGCGMAPESLRHIFDKFYQGDTSHSREGNGLGLALVRRILILMNGEIQVESKEGEGSVFTVRLPRTEEREDRNRIAGNRIAGDEKDVEVTEL